MDGVWLILGLCTGFFLLCLALGVINTTIKAWKDRRKNRPLEPWRVIRDSILGGLEKWDYVDRSGETRDYKIYWQLKNKDTNTAIGILWGGKSDFYKNEVFFYKDSKVKVALSYWEQRALYKAVGHALAKFLKKKIMPEHVDYRDGHFFCPYCGEKVATSIVEEKETPEDDDGN